MPRPIIMAADAIDLSPRVVDTTTIVGSPAAAAETTVASLTVSSDLVVASGILLVGYCAFTVGTNGVGTNLKIHHTNAAGATLGATGLVTATAANLQSLTVMGFDAVPTATGPIY